MPIKRRARRGKPSAVVVAATIAPSSLKAWHCFAFCRGRDRLVLLERTADCHRNAAGFFMGLNWLCHRFPKTMSVILFIVNVLLSGRRALSELFPGFEQDLMRHGAVPLRAGLGVRIEHPGYDPFPQRDLGWSSYGVSRPTIERAVRRRVETFGDSYRAYMERTGRIFP